LRHRRASRAGVAKGDRVLLPEYGGQTVKLNDTECVAAAAAASLRCSERAPRQLTARVVAARQVHAVPRRGDFGRAEGRVKALRCITRFFAPRRRSRGRAGAFVSSSITRLGACGAHTIRSKVPSVACASIQRAMM